MIQELMASRRSIRRFTAEVPDRARIERLVEAAVTAPSASNKQPWRFVIVTNRDVIARLATAVREAVERVARHVERGGEAAFREYGDAFARFEGAPVIIVPLCQPLTILSSLLDRSVSGGDQERVEVMEATSGLLSVGLAVENLILAAHAGGLGACVMTGPLLAADRVRAILEIPPSWRPVAFIPVGFPAETPVPTGRKPAGQVARWIE